MTRAIPLAAIVLALSAVSAAGQSTSRTTPSKNPPKGPPPNATARCVDGAYTASRALHVACEAHGGVSQWFVQPEGVTASQALLGTAAPTYSMAASKPAPKTVAPAKPAPKPATRSSKPAAKPVTTAKPAAKPVTAARPTTAVKPATTARTAKTAKPGKVDASLMGTASALDKPPAGATAKCKDGTFSTSASRSDACKKNGGAVAWY